MVSKVFFIISSISFWMIGCSSSSASEGWRKVESRRQVVYSADRSTVYVVLASCEVKENPRGGVSDFSVKNPAIYVVKQSLGYQKEEVLFGRRLKKTHEYSGTTLWPSWSQSYVPSESFVLPSAGLFYSGNRLLLLFFKGDGWEVFRLDGDRFKADAVSKNVWSRVKGDFFQSAFRPDDVYWDYGLVQYADFFGRKGTSIFSGNQKFVTTETLFPEWEAIKGSQSNNDGD